MKKTNLLVAVVAVAWALVAGSSAQAAVFMKLDGIDGESVDELHQGAIDVHSWSWGMSNSGTVAGGGGVGKATFKDFTFMKALDKSSPVLALACASGEHIKSAKLFVRKAGGGREDYYEITLSEVFVTGIESSGDSDGVPMESISLNFSKIEWSYRPASADGTLGEPIRAGWDIKANVKI